MAVPLTGHVAALVMGQVVVSPHIINIVEGTNMTYTIRPGDTFHSIAMMHSMSTEELMRANPGVNPYNLRIGQQIVIPMGHQGRR